MKAAIFLIVATLLIAACSPQPTIRAAGEQPNQPSQPTETTENGGSQPSQPSASAGDEFTAVRVTPATWPKAGIPTSDVTAWFMNWNIDQYRGLSYAVSNHGSTTSQHWVRGEEERVVVYTNSNVVSEVYYDFNTGSVTECDNELVGGQMQWRCDQHTRLKDQNALEEALEAGTDAMDNPRVGTKTFDGKTVTCYGADNTGRSFARGATYACLDSEGAEVFSFTMSVNDNGIGFVGVSWRTDVSYDVDADDMELQYS